MRTRVIGVTGAKGSPGTSVVAAALALRLSEAGIATLLVDADSEGGTLATQFDVQEPPRGAADVARNLSLLDLSKGARDAVDRSELVENARSSCTAIVIDLGHHCGQLQTRLSMASDWLLWVVMPDRSGLERADRAIASSDMSVASAGLVLNRISCRTLADAGRALSSRHGMPVLACIRESTRIADRVSQGRPVHRLRSLRRALSELARCVHPDAPPAGRAWP